MIETLLVLALALQDDTAKATAILEESAAALRKGKTVLIEMESEFKRAGQPPELTQFTTRRIALKAPDLYRQERRERDEETLAIGDGKFTWVLDKKNLEYSKYPARRPTFEDCMPARLYFADNPAVFLGTEVSVKPHKEGQVITWNIRRHGTVHAHWLLIGKNKLPLTYSVEGKLDNLYEHNSEFKRVDLDAEFPADTFTFTPPEGATLKVPEAPPAPTPEKPPKGKDVDAAVATLAKTAAALKKGPSLSYQTDTVTTGPSERTWKGRIVAQPPNLYRVDLEHTVLACDGKGGWYYFPSHKNYTRFTPIQMPFLHAEPVLALYLEPALDRVFTGAGDIQVREEKGRRIVAWNSERHSGSKYQMAFDATTDLPVEYSSEHALDGDVFKLVTTYRDFDFAATPAPEMFTFTPPAGVKERTQAETDPMAALLDPGTEVPAMTGIGKGGKEVSLADFKGRPVLLSFCNANLKELKWVQSLHDAYGAKGLAVVAVHWPDAAKPMTRRIESEKFTFATLGLKEGFPINPLGVRSLATVYILDRDGKVFARMIKNSVYQYNERSLLAILERLTAQGAK